MKKKQHKIKRFRKYLQLSHKIKFPQKLILTENSFSKNLKLHLES